MIDIGEDFLGLVADKGLEKFAEVATENWI
jgi:hypothetical protein